MSKSKSNMHAHVVGEASNKMHKMSINNLYCKKKNNNNSNSFVAFACASHVTDSKNNRKIKLLK
jgi:hypothetical protein